MTAIPTDLLDAYETTTLEFYGGFEPGERPAYVITGARPYGEPLTPSRNQQLHEALFHYLRGHSLVPWLVGATAADGTVEDCWAVHCDIETACLIGRVFHQHAIFEVTAAGKRLVEC